MAGKTEYKNKYNTENYDRVALNIKKGAKEKLADLAKEQGTSLAGFIKSAVQDKYAALTSEDIDL